MSDEMTTVVGQLSITAGNWQNTPLNQVAVREPQSKTKLGAGKGDLFILTDVLGDVSELADIEQKLAETVRDKYYLARGSITASLRRAVESANAYLYQHNVNIDIDQRVVGGVVALVFCQEDVFVAQTGPTAFFAVSGNQVKRYPEQSIWLDSDAKESNETALGISTFIEPNLYHIQVSSDDVLVLADSYLVEEVAPVKVAEAVTAKNIRTAIKNLGQAANNHDCSALTLTVVEANNGTLGSLNMPISTHLHKLLPTNAPSPTDEFPVSSSATSPSPLEKLTQFNPFKQSTLNNEGYPNNDEIYSSKEAHSNNNETYPKNYEPPAHHETNGSTKAVTPLPDDSTTISSTMMASTTPKPAFEPHLQQNSANANLMWRNLSTAILMIIANLANGLKNLISGTALSSDDHPRQAGTQAPPVISSLVPWKSLLGIAVAIPLVALAVVAISYLRNERLKETEYATLVATAQTKVNQAEVVEDSSAFSLIAEAENLLSQADTIKTGQPEVAELRTRIAASTDDISNVQRLTNMPHLRSYTDAGTSLSELLVQGVELYVLDRGTNRVYHHRLDNQGTGLLPDDEMVLLAQKGQAVDTMTINNLVDLVWMPSGGNRQTSDLLILGDTSLLEFNPNWGLTTTALANQAELQRPVAVDSFFGNFYVLDSHSNRILRYLPTADGYSALPENYFPPDQPVDLAQAVDFAIDGAVYVLYLDGRIAKFSSGRPTSFEIQGIDKPLKMPSAIFTAPDEEVQNLYIADTGNQRIVELDKNGNFIRQFKPSVAEGVTFANLQDIFVDEISQRIYILDSNNLYMAGLP